VGGEKIGGKRKRTRGALVKKKTCKNDDFSRGMGGGTRAMTRKVGGKYQKLHEGSKNWTGPMVKNLDYSPEKEGSFRCASDPGLQYSQGKTEKRIIHSPDEKEGSAKTFTCKHELARDKREPDAWH